MVSQLLDTLLPVADSSTMKPAVRNHFLSIDYFRPQRSKDVFDHNTVVLAKGADPAGNYFLGRPWGSESSIDFL